VKRDHDRPSAGTRGSNQRNQEKSRKEARHRKIGDREIEEAKNLDIKNREIPIRDIPIQSGPSDHPQIWTVEKSKGDFFFAFRRFESQRNGKIP
jgi:hypothetical protein